MRSTEDKSGVVFENVWKRDASHLSSQILDMWANHGGPVGAAAMERLQRLVLVVKTNTGDVVGISTSEKLYLKRLRNYFFAIKIEVISALDMPDLWSDILVSTRDFLESIHSDDSSNPAIGIVAHLENDPMRVNSRAAIWPGSGMVYIGNTAEGHHIRVYYFKGARIIP